MTPAAPRPPAPAPPVPAALVPAPPAAVLALRTVVVVVVLLGVLSRPASTFGAPALALDGLGRSLRYFTVQSNLLLAVVLAWSVLAAGTARRGPSAWVVGGATFFVTVTFLVYNTVLVPGGGPGAVLLFSGRPSSDLLHVVAPLLALADWVLLRPHPGFAVRRSLWWLLYPLLYTAVSLLAGAGDGFYPYFFVDPPQIGWSGVGVAVLVLLPAFALLALAFGGADRALGRRTTRRPATG